MVKRLIPLLALLVSLALFAEDSDSVWAKRRRDDPVVDQYYGDPWINRARDELLAIGLQAYYQNRVFWFPSIDVEIALGRYFALGLFGNFHRSTGDGFSFTAYDFLATANIYPFGKFESLWIRFGTGAFGTSISSSTSVTKIYPTVAGSLGWRFFIFDPEVLFTVGILFGGQAYFGPKTAAVPNAMLEVGLFL